MMQCTLLQQVQNTIFTFVVATHREARDGAPPVISIWDEVHHAGRLPVLTRTRQAAHGDERDLARAGDYQDGLHGSLGGPGEHLAGGLQHAGKRDPQHARAATRELQSGQLPRDLSCITTMLNILYYS